MSTRVHLNRECMHFYKVLEYGLGRPSPEQKLRDVNLNFSEISIFPCKFGYFRYFLRDDSFFFYHLYLSTILYFLQIYGTNNRRASLEARGKFPGCTFRLGVAQVTLIMLSGAIRTQTYL
jgi:hypothetical protein